MANQTMDNKMNNTNVNNINNDMFKAMNDNFRSAFDNSVKFQQETMKAVTNMFTNCDTMDDCKGKFETMANDTVSMVRKNAEQTQKAFDESCKSGINMMKKTFDTAKADNKDMFAQTRDMFSGMFDMMKTNMEMFTKTTTATIENVSEFVTKTMDMKKTK